MNPNALIDSMERFPPILVALVAGTSDADMRWRPDGESWSILEILCHLADEEVEDFRQRLRLTLEDATAPWPPIDPEGAASSRKYNEQSPEAVLERFRTARQESVAWLRSLTEPHWETSHSHPIIGDLAAGDLLLSWASHDALHLRQIAKRRFQLLERDGAPFRSRYAGQWTA